MGVFKKKSADVSAEAAKITGYDSAKGKQLSSVNLPVPVNDEIYKFNERTLFAYIESLEEQTYPHSSDSSEKNPRIFNAEEAEKNADEMKCSGDALKEAEEITNGFEEDFEALYRKIKNSSADDRADERSFNAEYKETGSCYEEAEEKKISEAMVNGGAALYAYAKGDVSKFQLKDLLMDTTFSAAAAIYYTGAVRAILGANLSPLVPMAAYTAASMVFTCTREIIREAKLEKDQFDRMAAMYQESEKCMNIYHEQLKLQIAQCKENQQRMMNQLIHSYNYNIRTGENYDQAVEAIVRFAAQAGIILEYTDFDEFSEAMRRKETFFLG